MNKLIILLSAILLFSNCNKSKTPIKNVETHIEAISLLGKTLKSTKPDSRTLANYKKAKAAFLKDSSAVEKYIWFGRRVAYLSHYNEAIEIYSNGLKRFPNDPRLYRHRGHRYITLRKFYNAIPDLEKAVELIEGKEDQVEPDGIPNAQNIPVSSLHTNIWYHLGLAHYLKHDFEAALEAFQNCYIAGTNDDNKVSSTNWLYMILRRLGRKKEAAKVLENISPQMNVIENTVYHDLCLFYKGEKKINELMNPDSGSSRNDAILYGVANWYYYNDNPQKAKEIFVAILSKDSWNSFGYIAAEAEMANLTKNNSKK